jgi:hypothetical protein
MTPADFDAKAREIIATLYSSQHPLDVAMWTKAGPWGVAKAAIAQALQAEFRRGMAEQAKRIEQLEHDLKDYKTRTQVWADSSLLRDKYVHGLEKALAAKERSDG